MRILAIDPGAKQSGYVIWEITPADKYNEAGGKLIDNGIVVNPEILELIESQKVMPDRPRIVTHVAIERIRGFGIVAGDDVFDTCEWVGRFEYAALMLGLPVELIPRKDIKKHLCGTITTNDKYVRMALIDRFGETGTKKAPGPLFGVSGHCWSALAVAVTATDLKWK